MQNQCNEHGVVNNNYDDGDNNNNSSHIEDDISSQTELHVVWLNYAP